jgi:hypothetical protein
MYNYLIVFLTVVGINLVPLFMPPTWLVLALFYVNFPSSIIVLALLGASASTIGRFGLTYVGTFFRRFMGTKEQKNMDYLGVGIRTHPVKSFFITLVYALSPLPSNVYFITLGLSRVRAIPIFLGFFFGRLISYSVLLFVSREIFRHLARMFTETWIQVAIIDVVGVIFMIIFISMDWHALMTKGKLKFMPLRLKKK